MSGRPHRAAAAAGKKQSAPPQAQALGDEEGLNAGGQVGTRSSRPRLGGFSDRNNPLARQSATGLRQLCDYFNCGDCVCVVDPQPWCAPSGPEPVPLAMVSTGDRWGRTRASYACMRAVAFAAAASRRALMPCLSRSSLAAC